MADVVLFGTGQFAEVAKAYLDWEGSHRVVAFAVNTAYLTDPVKDGLPVVAWEDLRHSHPPGQVHLFCPLSYRGMNQHRQEIFEQGLGWGYDFISFIHPKAQYYDTPVGRNCMILEANVIQPHTAIGDNCILWSGNHIGHHTVIGAHCFLASHVVISGSVACGPRCFFGVNATVRDNLRLGAACMVGAGGLVTRDLEDGAVVTGPKMALSRLQSHQLRGI